MSHLRTAKVSNSALKIAQEIRSTRESFALNSLLLKTHFSQQKKRHSLSGYYYQYFILGTLNDTQEHAMMHNRYPPRSTWKPEKPVIRGKGKALNTIAAASGRDPAAIVKSVTEAEVSAETATFTAEDEVARRAASKARAKTKDEAIESHVFNQLTSQEKFRFTCFRRCGFAHKPIEKFVAKMLVLEMETRHMARRGTLVGLGCRLCGEGGSSNEDLPFKNNAAGAAVITDTSDADTLARILNKKRTKYSRKQILMNESRRRKAVIDQSQHCMHDGPLSNSSHTTQSLANLVVANSASDIVVVVSLLAKCYGQRLVAGAKMVAKAGDEKAEFNVKSSTNERISSSTLLTPLQPRHFIEAHQKRVRAGLDPCFWMGSRVGQSDLGSVFRLREEVVAEAAALEMVDRNSLLAALAARDLHDRELHKDDEKKRVDEDIMMETDKSKNGQVPEKDGISESAHF